jgi:hypothetical protein
MWKHFSMGTYPDVIAPGQAAEATGSVEQRSTVFWISCVEADSFQTGRKKFRF